MEFSKGHREDLSKEYWTFVVRVSKAFVNPVTSNAQFPSNLLIKCGIKCHRPSLKFLKFLWYEWTWYDLDMKNENQGFLCDLKWLHRPLKMGNSEHCVVPHV